MRVRALAIETVPTPSIFEAIIGMPVHGRFEWRNVNVRCRSTSFLVVIVLRLGRISTSEKSNLVSLSIRTFYIKYKIYPNENIKLQNIYYFYIQPSCYYKNFLVRNFRLSNFHNHELIRNDPPLKQICEYLPLYIEDHRAEELGGLLWSK